MRNHSVSACPACGVRIPSRKELPFLTRQAWRNSVADKLGYDRSFIRDLGEHTRIHANHFAEIDIRNGKPIGLPQFNIVRINDWPTPQNLCEPAKNMGTEIKVEVDVDDFKEDKSSNDQSLNESLSESQSEPKCVLVEVEQLKLLLRQCHYCGHNINTDVSQCKMRGGIFSTKFWCNKCRCYRYWRSCASPFSQLITGATMMCGISIAKILQLFAIMQCAFPSVRNIFYAAQHVVRPAIQSFYENQRRELLNQLQRIGTDLHLCMIGQCDSPSYSAYYYTVTAVEPNSRKIVGFSTVFRTEVNAEACAVRRLMNELRSKDIRIASVTTDKNSSISDLFESEYPNVQHYFNLWHILRDMYRKFSPKFNAKHPNLKNAFSSMVSHIWKYGSERRQYNHDNLMLEKCLSTLLHLAGIHRWQEGKFVDIFNSLVYEHDFDGSQIQDVWMINCLSCDHAAADVVEREILDPASAEFLLLLQDLCSDLRLNELRKAAHVVSDSPLESYHSDVIGQRPKRYHFWYIDVHNMLAVLHHNEGVDNESRDDKAVLRQKRRVARANGEPYSRTQKTLIFDWQKNIMDFIGQDTPKYVTESRNEEIQQEFVESETNDEPVSEMTADVDKYWNNFFNNIVKL